MKTEREIDTARCEALVERICAGDEEAWKPLVEHLWPHWLVLVRASRRMGPLAKSDDHVHDVLAELVDKLGTDGGRAITTYPRWKEENPGKTFADWIRIVTSYTLTDYVRATLGRGSKSTDEEGRLPSIKRLLNEFSISPAGEEAFGQDRPKMTAAQTARELFDYAREKLPSEQLTALSLWLDGASFEEIDASLALEKGDDEASKKLVRAAIASLRRRFAGADERAKDA